MNTHAPAPAPRAPTADPPRRRAALAALTLFVGLTALAGGVELITWPRGNPDLGLDPTVLRHSPFTDFTLPGLILFAGVGLPNTLAGLAALRRHPRAAPLALIAGALITGWIVIEALLLRTFHPLQALYLTLGLATLALARRAHRPVTSNHTPSGPANAAISP
ncbi:MAG: hypothetical protein H6703_17300 [Myxococcales bacterium]|nr:hypothetical protein [Myxococcales bacterium]